MILTIDFETFYSQTFSLTKLTTEEYIRSPEFEVVGVAVQVDDGEPEWFSGSPENTYQFLRQFDWANSIAIAHNAMFDGAILNWIYGIRPKGWIDTLSMARALHGTEVGGSLKVLAEYYGLGVKGTEVVNALGLKREQFSAEQLALYGEYCKNDVALTWKLFRAMSESFPAVELRLIDLTIKMFTEPVLQLDKNALIDHLAEVKERKAAVLGLFDKEVLMSNPKFAEALTELGVTPPMKVSPANGKQTYAFSKTDEEFKALLEHPNDMVQALVTARLGTKSTIEETRTERFIGIAERGPLPVPLRYYAAHTGRWGGDDKLNLQNLPRSSPLKNCIIAPEGYVILDSDSSQIEARTLAWLAGQEDLVLAFENGEDVYRIMASRIYNKPEQDVTKSERFVGKTTILGCIAEGTLVLCSSGWKPIEQVTTEDQLWDGDGWVCHQGLQNSGIKETLNLCGVWLTPDHKVWSGTQWLEAQSVVADAATLSLALDTGARNLPAQATYKARKTGAGLQTDKKLAQTYDIAYAGANNRFMIATDAGALIVHNCGYGMGAAKFKVQLKNFGVEVELDECRRIIDTYRSTYPAIPKLWNSANNALNAILRNQSTTLGSGDILGVEGANGVMLPNGLRLKYPNLRLRQDEQTGKTELVYDTKKGKALIPTRIYGGKMVENVCQALARIIIGGQMLSVAKKYRVVLTVHDAIACIVPKEEADTAKEYIELCMRLRPSWALDLPLNCEAGYGESYGDC